MAQLARQPDAGKAPIVRDRRSRNVQDLGHGFVGEASEEPQRHDAGLSSIVVGQTRERLVEVDEVDFRLRRGDGRVERDAIPVAPALLRSPPATRAGLVLAVRKHTLSDLSLADLGKAGSLPKLGQTASRDDERALRDLHAAGDVEAFLRLAVGLRKTIVLSGGTSSGKTTLLNALVKEIPPHERLVLIEDAPEIQLRHENAVGLIAARNETGEAQVDAEDLLQATLRMRPDRILLGELRGREAFTFLRAVNTGHPGSITTVHADSAQGAIDQIALLSLLSGVDLGWETVRSYVRQVVDVVVQLKRVDGARRVTELEFLGS